MHPEPSVEQRQLQESVARFCRERVTPERLLAWQSSERGIDDATWRAIAELGWLGIGVAEEHGGSGLGLVEVACVLEQCGRGLIPQAVIHAVRGAVALAELEPTAPELRDLACGAATLTLALDERAAREAGALRTRIVEGPGGLSVGGEKCFVPTPGADLHIVAARRGDAVVLALLDGGAAAVQTLRAFDGAPQGVVRYDEVPVLRLLHTEGQGDAALRRLRRAQTALALAEMVGGMRAALETTVAYVKEREQFGQKIGVFQAVQHQIADMATAHTASRHLAWQAITRFAAGSEQGVELEMAAAFVARSFKDITLAAHHLHGGAGYIVEHPLHLHAERAQALCLRYAPEAAALAAIAAHLLD
jgi:alkylation response protein AidB-like acyl-CoA dehydrogenase